MVEFGTNFFMKFSGAGWWEYIQPESWEGIVISSLIFLGIFTLTSLIWLIVRVFKDDTGNRWSSKTNRETRSQRIIIKPFLFLLYFVFNIFVNILVLIIGMTAGGVIGFGIVMAAWGIFQIVALISQHDDGDGKIDGVFNIFGVIDQYANKLAEFMLHRKTLKDKYQQYLKIEY